MNIKDKIIIKDNFFKLKTLNAIKNQLSSVCWNNRYNKIKSTVYNKIYFNQILDSNHFAVKEMNQKLKIFNIKYDIKKTNSEYWLSTKHKNPTPHTDINYINCLIYLKGDHLINSGTGFYDKIGNNIVLNTHVGFKENRAIIFDSKIRHSSLQFSENSGTRYVMVNFLFKKIKKNKK